MALFFLVVSKVVKIGSYLVEYSVACCIWASVNSLETGKYLLYDIFIAFWCILLECIYS